MEYQCEIVDQPAQPVLCVRTNTPVSGLPAVIGQIYGQVMQRFGTLGEQPAGPPYVAYFNMDMQDLHLEAGFAAQRMLEGESPVLSGSLPGGPAATCLHTGPYPELGAAYDALTRFVMESGREPTGVSYEFYLNDPLATPPDQLETRIVFPLK